MDEGQDLEADGFEFSQILADLKLFVPSLRSEGVLDDGVFFAHLPLLSVALLKVVMVFVLHPEHFLHQLVLVALPSSIPHCSHFLQIQLVGRVKLEYEMNGLQYYIYGWLVLVVWG